MEKRTTHRIIGALVAVALVIILLPLLFNGNMTINQTAANKAPPFPDQQSKPVSDVPAANIAQNDAANVAPQAQPAPTEQTPLANNNDLANPAANNPSNDSNNLQPVADAAPVKNQDNSLLMPVDNAPLPMNPNNNTAANKTEPQQPPVIQPANNPDKQAKQPIIKTASNHPADKNLSQLKTAAWVVQMGSFKNKSNAQRLANQLRAKGYKAFMHNAKSAHGEERTQVYVGPEYKKVAAAELATKLEEVSKLHGIIVHYKPLQL